MGAAPKHRQAAASVDVCEQRMMKLCNDKRNPVLAANAEVA